MNRDHKGKAQAKIDEHNAEIVEISKRIYQNPETRFEERQAVATMTGALEKWGFDVQTGLAGLDTAFCAKHRDTAPGPVIAFVAEYDALPDLGHACGHNLIAGAGLGALLAFQDIKDEIPGTVELLGTPGEEGGAGKLIMLERGLFDHCDAALMFHPSSFTAMNPRTLALVELSITFHGKASHAAASPENGINALDGVIQTFNGINALREYLREDARIHGIITKGGENYNVIPEIAEAIFTVRAKDGPYCEELLAKLERCAEGAAQACGAKVTISERGRRKALVTNRKLSSLFSENLRQLNEDIRKGRGGLFSTDMGDVSHFVPSIHPMISICNPGISLHSREFALAANSERGYSVMIKAANALAMTAIDFLMSKKLQRDVDRVFRTTRPSRCIDGSTDLLRG